MKYEMEYETIKKYAIAISNLNNYSKKLRKDLKILLQ